MRCVESEPRHVLRQKPHMASRESQRVARARARASKTLTRSRVSSDWSAGRPTGGSASQSPKSRLPAFPEEKPGQGGVDLSKTRICQDTRTRTPTPTPMSTLSILQLAANVTRNHPGGRPSSTASYPKRAVQQNAGAPEICRWIGMPDRRSCGFRPALSQSYLSCSLTDSDLEKQQK